MYATTIDDQPLTFWVAGVWRRNMVIRDRQTSSVWQQATGEAIAGPLKGRRLQPIGGSLMRWKVWRDAHPNGILSTEPDPPAPNLLSVEGMVRLFDGTRLAAGPGYAARHDHRLPLHEVIIGIDLNGAARAYPLQTLREIGHMDDTLEGQLISLHYHADGDYVEATFEGKPVPVERQWWLGWSEFHPHTDVYTSQT